VATVEPKMMSCGEWLVMGVQVSGNPMEIDYRSVWADQYMKLDAQLQPLREDEAYYGVFFETAQPNCVDHVAGVRVPVGTDAIPGAVARTVPAAEYAVFGCTVETLGATWNSIMQEWLPASAYEYDVRAAGYERYAAGGAEDASVAVYVPVVAKAA
jgi:predicted transcriptional regulator YdeE